MDFTVVKEKITQYLNGFDSVEAFIASARAQNIRALCEEPDHCLMAVAIYRATGVHVSVDLSTHYDGDNRLIHTQTNIWLDAAESDAVVLPATHPLTSIPERFDQMEWPDLVVEPVEPPEE